MRRWTLQENDIVATKHSLKPHTRARWKDSLTFYPSMWTPATRVVQIGVNGNVLCANGYWYSPNMLEKI